MKSIASCAPVAVLVLAAVAMSPAPAAAQGLGLGGGLNLSRLVGENQTIVRSEQRTGLNLGGTFSLRLMRALTLQPEVYYSQKGQEQEFASGTGPSGLATLSLDYVEVPVLAKITLPGTRSIRPHIAAGPAFAWNVRCKYDVETESSNEGGDCADNPGALEFGKADRGGVAGGGALLSLGVIGVVLEARVVRGLKRLEEEATTGDSKNQVFSFLARLSFSGM